MGDGAGGRIAAINRPAARVPPAYTLACQRRPAAGGRLVTSRFASVPGNRPGQARACQARAEGRIFARHGTAHYEPRQIHAHAAMAVVPQLVTERG